MFKKIISLSCIISIMIFSIFAQETFAEEAEQIKLMAPQLDRGKLLMEALKERKSQRVFSERELPIDLLSNLLWAASGVNRPDSGKMTVPTAMDFREIDIYVAMESGLYLYKPVQNILKLVIAKDIRAAVGVQDFTQKAPVNLIYVSDLSKMSVDEDDKVFYSATDTGFISQNVYLFCASEGLSTVVLGWVDKPALAKKMGLSKKQMVILAQPVGYSE